jgi:hypothetical protein
LEASVINLIGYDQREDETVERELSAHGLRVISDMLDIKEDLWVYGCGPFYPGRDFDELIEHSQAGDFLGIVGLFFTEFSVAALHHELRAHLGAVLQLAPSVFVPDKLGTDWCLHYAVRAKLGGHPAWACPIDRARLISTEWDKRGKPATSVGEIVALAVLVDPLHIVFPPHPRGSAHNVVYSEVRRFVEQCGLSNHVDSPSVVSGAILVREHKRAADTIKEMYEIWKARQATTTDTSPVSVWSKVAGACAASTDPADQLPAGDRPRELVIGTKFDPSTHYDDAYFGEGSGLLYTRPDGSKDVYHGPAHEWEGMRVAAEFLWRVLPWNGNATMHPKLIDIGSGSGCFVGHAGLQGFDAVGYDISEAAVARAKARGRNVQLRDVVKNPPSEPADVVTALDFWEHIYLDDIDTLIEAVKGCMMDGGFGFFIICTRTSGERDWTIKKGDVLTKENSWMLASGHVTLRLWGWWVAKFVEHGFQLGAATAYRFQVLRDEEIGLVMAESWRPKNLVVVRKGDK